MTPPLLQELLPDPPTTHRINLVLPRRYDNNGKLIRPELFFCKECILVLDKKLLGAMELQTDECPICGGVIDLCKHW